MFASKSFEKDPNIALAKEFKALASLRHPNIVSVLDYGFDSNRQPYYSMEYFPDNKSFTELAEKKSIKAKSKLLVQLLQALVYLHRHNLMHRDLKPANVLVVDGIVKVVDFGISQNFKETVELSGDLSGTVAYMAPEMLQNQQVTTSSDLYSFGLIAYETFVGKLPFDTSNMAVLLADKLTKEIDVSDQGLPKKLEKVLSRLLQKNPKDRYQKASEVIVDLSKAVDIKAPKESTEIRESFLQAAKFVGRDSEMETLEHALGDAIEAPGQPIWSGRES